jgi:hypothetical protein
MHKIHTGLTGFTLAFCIFMGGSWRPHHPPEEGEQLAKRYCSTCHLYVPPEMLPIEIWEKSVLPNMAARLGVGDANFNPYIGMDPEEISQVIRANIFPEKPLLSATDWQKIAAFYRSKAPAKLPQIPTDATKKDSLAGFSVQVLPFQKGKYPAITYAGFGSNPHEIFIGDKRRTFFRLTKGLMTDSFRVESPVSDVVRSKEALTLLQIGVLEPNDLAKGSIWQKNAAGLTNLQRNLLRPVHLNIFDVNEDGKPDRIICQHGNYMGKLSWFENKGADKYEEHVLRQMPGARLTQIVDWNKDGKLDILALFAQGNEGIWVYLNLGKGKFEERKLLDFSPVFGSSYLEASDFNGDGWLDLLYTNGDNADLSAVLKPYHGVRIFLNDKKGNVKEHRFFPVNGASKALARDFDLDGDLDIACIAYFNEPDQNEGFLYFENTGNLNFKISTMPEAQLGKWLVMDCADTDADGDLDLVIGSLVQRSLGNFRIDPQNPPPSIIILENQKKKSKQ